MGKVKFRVGFRGVGDVRTAMGQRNPESLKLVEPKDP